MSGDGSSMTFLNQEHLTAERFLRDYWQKKALLLRQALPGFEPELDANDIAGLACTSQAEARLITGRFPDPRWSVRHGPFQPGDFSALPERHWTLLVQDVEKHYPRLRRLLALFQFLPQWRIDDIMASVAGPGGSVGPHVDQYDVFLLQASGKRRWEIAEQFAGQLLPDCELNVLEQFEAEQTWILETGDILYLPPGVAHHGVALDETAPCMTWSIGMRAPSAADLLLALGEWLAETRQEGPRYRDPEPGLPRYPGGIDATAIQRIGDLARSVLADDELFPQFLGSFLSRYRLARDPETPQQLLTPGDLREALAAGGRLQPSPWTRLTWLQSAAGTFLFAGGEPYPCGSELAETLCNLSAVDGLSPVLGEAGLSLVCQLINQGHLTLEPL
jgi:50S ribosomal protein L16 3-hydroxylase